MINIFIEWLFIFLIKFSYQYVSLFSYENLQDYIDVTQIIQNNLSMPEFLIQSYLQSLFCHVTCITGRVFTIWATREAFPTLAGQNKSNFDLLGKRC